MTVNHFEFDAMGYTDAVAYLKTRHLYDDYMKQNPEADYLDVICHANSIMDTELAIAQQ